MRRPLGGIERQPRGFGVVLIIVAALPAIYYAWAVFSDLFAGTRNLGSDPIKEAEHLFGNWTLKFLLATLAITPLRRITGWNWLIRFRRMFGLFAFFYLILHFSVYAGLDHRFNLSEIGEDIIKRPYITLGMTGLILLIPLALTSTAGMMRRLGRRWLQLHRLVYVVAILGAWHFYWQVKKDISEPLIYAGILALLLGFRILAAWQKRRRIARQNAPSNVTVHGGPERALEAP
jgi:sulfoxide reductase heme-binding subunit YedZ